MRSRTLFLALAMTALRPDAGIAQEASRPSPAHGPAATRILPEDERVSRTAWLMGTRARVEVEAESRGAALDASEAALRAMAETESRLSTWRDDSELARLNRAATGASVEAGAELAALLREVSAWTDRTAGAFDPAIGALVDAWDLRGTGHIPAPEALQAAYAASGSSGLHVDRSTGVVTRRHPGAWLDAGGFGKGAALREARDALVARDVGVAILDLGGQITALGPAPVTVAVAHPVERTWSVVQLEVSGASVATSGQSERGFDIDGARYGHILDPRDGRPAPAWGSVTVVAPDPLEADVLSTALHVMGPTEGLAWAAERGVAALFLRITESGVSERMTSAMEQYHVYHPNHPFHPLNP